MAWRLGGIKDDTHTWTVLIGVLALSIFFSIYDFDYRSLSRISSLYLALAH